MDLQQPAHPRRRDRVAAAAGPVVPGAARVPRTQPSAVRRPDLLHLSLRADRARREDRAAQEHPGADRARRAGDPPRDLQGAVQPAGRHRLQHRGRAAVPDDALLDPGGRGRDGRLRRRPAAGQPHGRDRNAAERTGRRPADDADVRGRRASRRILAELPPAPGAPRHRLPPPASAARAVRALRRAHRSRARAARS